MSLLNDASLVMIPSGYKDGTLYSAKPTNGDGDFTFSRGSNLAATRVNSEGLIEKGRENLALSSNDISTQSTYWVSNQGGTTLQNSAVAPDGTTTASTITANGTNTYSGVAQSGIVMGALRYTYSVYLKAQSGTPNIRLTSFDGVTFHQQDFSITTEWERYSITFTPTAGTHNIYITSTQAVSWYAWGAQFELGLVATDVITTTTTTAQAGILEDMPRLDYSGGASCGSLLLEPQRSNLVTQSEYFGAWTLNNVLITNNDTTSPEGLDNAAKWSASSGLSQKNIYQVLTCSSGVAHTTSVYFKADEYPLALIRLGGITDSPYVIYDLRDESVVSTSGLTSNTIESVGNNWYRIDATATTTGTVIAPNFAFLPESGYTLTSLNIPQYTGDGTSGGYIYGAMVEAGSYVSSYIPTYGSSVTRSADSCSKTGISSLIGQSEGTFYWEGSLAENPSGTNMQFSLSDGTTSQQIKFVISSSSTYVAVEIKNGGTQQFYNNYNIDAKTNRKYAIAYANNDFAFYIDGTQIATDTSGSVPSCSKLSFDSGVSANGIHGNFKSVTLFPTRLTNDELADLTTI